VAALKGGVLMTTLNKPPAVELQAGGRTWRIEGSPLKAPSGYANFRQFRLARRTDTQLVFAPTLHSQIFGLIFVAFGPGIAILIAWACVTIWPKAIAEGLLVGIGILAGMAAGIAINSVFVLLAITTGLRVMTQRVEFDKAAGTVTQRWLRKTENVRSLEEVVAIQLLDAGWVRFRRGRVHLFQINLVLEFPPGFRVNVCTEPDEGFVRDAARELAAFLGVPLVSQTSEGP
jgi:hypothetical protein